MCLEFRYKGQKKMNIFQKNRILPISLPFFMLLREGAWERTGAMGADDQKPTSEGVYITQ